MNTEITDPICCPPFDPTPWMEAIFEWKDKLFIKNKVCTLFYVPLNYGGTMKRLNRLLELNSAKTPDLLCLSDHTSKWNIDLYMAVNKEIVGANNVKMSGKFYSRVYEGDYKDTEKWCRDMEAQAGLKNLPIEKMYLWYTSCPKCAKKYGKNYVVIIAKIA
jgi:hypothetical protein